MNAGGNYNRPKVFRITSWSGKDWDGCGEWSEQKTQSTKEKSNCLAAQAVVYKHSAKCWNICCIKRYLCCTMPWI